jgi:hypothetical protein
MHKMVAVSIKEVLEQKEKFSGWLYLPQQPWTLETQGIFVDEDRDAAPSEPFPPAILAPCALQDALDAAGIDDVISNAQDQLGTPTISQLFEGFLFYVANDAYCEFDT